MPLQMVQTVNMANLKNYNYISYTNRLCRFRVEWLLIVTGVQYYGCRLPRWLESVRFYIGCPACCADERVDGGTDDYVTTK